MRGFATRLYYRPGDDGTGSPLRFKLVMGGFTLIAVGVTAPFFVTIISIYYFVGGIEGDATVPTAIILMWGFGVYLSLVIAKKYISEVSSRKRKVKRE